MKKIFTTIIILTMILVMIIIMPMVFSNCYATSGLGKWKVVQKEEIGVPAMDKIGDYYFKLEDNQLLYSTDGYNYAQIPGVDVCYLPIYSNGVYFVIDGWQATVPQNKRPSGFNNSPMYTLDENLNIIKKSEYRTVKTYRGYTNGYHWVSCDTKYADQGKLGNKLSVEKSADGVAWKVATDEEIDGDWYSHMVRGDKLYDGNIYYRPRNSEDKYLVMSGNEIKIIREDKGFVRVQSITEKIHRIATVVGYETVDWIYGRKLNQSIGKDFLSLDCIYGVEMPEDIGDYVFEYNDTYYFERDDSTYYCINKSELTGNIKVICNNELLAFTTPPTTENDRTLVPMRFLFEQMGAEVEWDDNTQTATVNKDGESISFSVDNTTASVNGELKTMDVPARLVNDKTMIPIRFLSEELGYNVQWDEATKTVTIN